MLFYYIVWEYTVIEYYFGGNKIIYFDLLGFFTVYFRLILKGRGYEKRTYQ
jgi:hypothetical protein